MTGSDSDRDTPQDGETRSDASTSASSGRIQYGEQSAHLAFQQQLAALLQQADITEEQRQQLLIAATCPCCGASGLSVSLDLKTDGTPQF